MAPDKNGATRTASSGSLARQPSMARSYSEQFAELKGTTSLDVMNAAPYEKPERNANEGQPGAYKLPFADFHMVKSQRPLLAADPKTLNSDEVKRAVRKMYFQRNFGAILHHFLALLVAPFFFTWRWLLIAEGLRFFLSCFGITVCYHRQLTHRSFKTNKYVEYFFAFLGVMAGQGPPIEWVCNHRYHHMHTDTPLDPHSPYEGFWWSHLGWFLDWRAAAERPMLDKSNVKDLTSQPFYVWLEAHWFNMLFIRFWITLALGWYLGGNWQSGMAAVCYTMAVPLVVSWHFTASVNSAAHIWGRRPYETGDLSTNNWFVSIGAYGEGWHNTHHAFPWSARHGLEWFEVDVTWMLIRTMQLLGIAWDVSLPTQKQLEAKRRKPAAAGEGAAADGKAAASSKPVVEVTATPVAPLKQE